MLLKEWNEVCKLDYTEFVSYLNKKYGAVKGNYYDAKPDGTLKKGKAGVKGYYIHHTREYEVPNLCDINVASKNPIEYQQSYNLVQADVLEHFFLHILIAEEFDKTGDFEVGEGGVIWIATTINGKINKGELIDEEYKVFLQLVNRYCTSSFIRQKHDLVPEDLLKKLLGQCSKVNRYEDYVAAVKDTKLFPWNINAFSDVRNCLRTNRTAGVVICTGGGKTTFALEYLRVYNARGLILGPSNTIGTGWDGNPDSDRFGYEYMNYQSFQNSYATLDYSKYDVVICDEMHHTEAPRWGEGLQFVLDNTDLKIIGLTATPTDDQKQGNDKYFNGRLYYGLDLATGIKEGHIHNFSYISAIYKLEREMFEKYGEAGRQLLGRLDLELNKNPIDKILRDNMPKGNRKIIVFVQEKEMINDAKEIMIKYNPKFATEEYARTIYSGLDTKYIDEAKDWFNEKHDHDVVLFTINMANEGAHFDGINTLIMFRKTNSSSLYLQQLGRIVVTSNKPDPEGIVFDFTNNAQTLINKPQVVVKKVKEVKDTLEETLETLETIEEADVATKSETADEEVILAIQEAIKEQAEKTKKNAGKVVIYKDYTEDCAETLAALYDAQKRSNTDAQIYVELQDELLNDEDFMELWKELKVETAGRLLISTKKGSNSSSGKTTKADKKAEDKDKEKTTTQTVLASDAERLATAYRLLVRRAYLSNAIEFADDIKVGIKNIDTDRLTNICKQLGIKKVEVIKKAMNNLAKLTFILAVNII